MCPVYYNQLPIFNHSDDDSPQTTGGEGGPVLCILTFKMVQIESNRQFSIPSTTTVLHYPLDAKSPQAAWQ